MPGCECVSLPRFLAVLLSLYSFALWLVCVCVYVSACRLGRFPLPIHHRDSLPAALTGRLSLLFAYAGCVCLPVCLRLLLAVLPFIALSPAPTDFRASILVVISLNCTPPDSSIRLTADGRAVCLVRVFSARWLTARCDEKARVAGCLLWAVNNRRLLDNA